MPKPDCESILEQQDGETGVLVGGCFILFEPSANRFDALCEMGLVDITIGKHLPPCGRLLCAFHPAIVANVPRLPSKTRSMDLGRHCAFLDLEQ